VIETELNAPKVVCGSLTLKSFSIRDETILFSSFLSQNGSVLLALCLHRLKFCHGFPSRNHLQILKITNEKLLSNFLMTFKTYQNYKKKINFFELRLRPDC